MMHSIALNDFRDQDEYIFVNGEPAAAAEKPCEELTDGDGDADSYDHCEDVFSLPSLAPSFDDLDPVYDFSFQCSHVDYLSQGNVQDIVDGVQNMEIQFDFSSRQSVADQSGILSIHSHHEGDSVSPVLVEDRTSPVPVSTTSPAPAELCDEIPKIREDSPSGREDSALLPSQDDEEEDVDVDEPSTGDPMEASSKYKAEDEAADLELAKMEAKGGRPSNKKRRKRLKLAKRAAAAAAAAAALSQLTTPPSPCSPKRTKKFPGGTTTTTNAPRNNKGKYANAAVACAAQTLSSYKEEVKRANKRFR